MDQVYAVSSFRPKPSDLVAFLPYACMHLEAPFQVRIVVETVEEYVSNLAADDRSKKAKRDKTPQVQTSATQYSAEKEPSATAPANSDENDVVLRARCDALGRPVELLLLRCVQIPRLLMKIFGLCVPYHEQLTKIIIRWSQLDGSVLYEIANFLPSSQVTEIRLDDSPVLHRNYHLLLERQSQLRILSLARCDLADEECAALAARLAQPAPASCGLVCLSLEANRIGDAGARALGEALRTNRSLRHVNLAGNAITSLGAAYILCSLTRFLVSYEEMVLKRARTFEYLKLKREAYSRCYRELVLSPEQAPESTRARLRSTATRSRRNSANPLVSVKSAGANALMSRAEMMAAEAVGAWSDPFDSAELENRCDETYCTGNFSLSYLNLAYNDLDYTIAAQLAGVLEYQASRTQRSGSGLLRVVLEGNTLPAECSSTRTVEQLLQRALDGAGTSALSHLKPGRRSERAKLKSN